MVTELLIATLMILVTVGMHAAGILAMVALLKDRDRRKGQRRINPLSFEAAWVTTLIILGLFILHGLQIWLYATLFHYLGAVENLREAIYFSTISYAAIGYGDASIAPEWKQLGAIEGINGVILLGWSVAFFVTVMARMMPAPNGGARRSERPEK
jgi:hypothetical protein